MTQIIEHLSEVSDRYDALFVDLWGCIHNGLKPFDGAVKAMQDYRKKGGTVIYVTNAPRHRTSVQAQLEGMGVADDAHDDIATSGDSARYALFQGAVGNKVYFIGQPHEHTFFDPLSIVENPAPISQVPLDQAEGIVCTGPTDPMADLDAHRAELLYAKQKGLKLLCANPDIVVDRGEAREWCAGALAQLYTEMGGESLYFGKPHPPIYDLARRRLAAGGKDVDPSRILCIGDGILTDVKGAMGEDLDCLFISGGLAATETQTTYQPDPGLLSAYLEKEMANPTYTIGFLR